MPAPDQGTVQTVLVVDDEPIVLKTLTFALRHYGYNVLAAAEGSAALTLAEEFSGVIDLLVCDVLMPDLCGPDLAERLLAVRPDMRVLFTAGHPSHPIVEERVIARGLPFLPKPFGAQALVSLVREILARKTTAARCAGPRHV